MYLNIPTTDGAYIEEAHRGGHGLAPDIRVPAKCVHLLQKPHFLNEVVI